MPSSKELASELQHLLETDPVAASQRLLAMSDPDAAPCSIA